MHPKRALFTGSEQQCLNILNMASMCGGRLKYLRNGYSMMEMT